MEGEENRREERKEIRGQGGEEKEGNGGEEKKEIRGEGREEKGR